jgi:hypothetical protein
MEVEASQVGGDGCSREGLNNSSTQRQMEEEVQQINVKPKKVFLFLKKGLYDLRINKVYLLVLKQGKVKKQKSCLEKLE